MAQQVEFIFGHVFGQLIKLLRGNLVPRCTALVTVTSGKCVVQDGTIIGRHCVEKATARFPSCLN